MYRSAMIFWGTCEEVLINHRIYRFRAAYAQVVRIVYQLLSETAGHAIVDESSGIVLVLENSLDHDVGPRTLMMIGDVRQIELSCNFNVRFSLDNKLLKYPSHDRDLFLRSKPKSHAVRFQSFALSLRQLAFRTLLLIDHLPVESERERATNAIAEPRYLAVSHEMGSLGDVPIWQPVL
ncbi:hypothetical protein V1278_003052 [Bradyrhizobium sp. AZCC 1577]